MKVLIVQGWAEGGTARYSVELVRALRQEGGHSVDLMVLVPERYQYGRDDPAVVRCLPAIHGAGSRFAFLNGFSIFLRRFLQMRVARKTIRQWRPDVVHVLGNGGVGAAFLASCWRQNAKSVVTVHDLPPRRAAWRPDVGVKTGGVGFLFAHRVIVHGAWTGQELVRRFGRWTAKRVRRAEQGLYDYGTASDDPLALRQRYELPAARPVALFFGSLRRNKGLSTAIRALPHLKDLEMVLFVVGFQPSRSEPAVRDYQRQAEEAGVTDMIVWKEGWIPDNEIPDVFGVADLLLMPYETSFSGQSGVLRVAEFYGVPVVASDAGEIAAQIEQTRCGFTFPAGSAVDLAKSIRNVASETVDRSGSVRLGHRESWVPMGRVVLTAYREVLGAPRSWPDNYEAQHASGLCH